MKRISEGFPVPEDAGLLIPGTPARVQLKTVPAVPLAGIYVNKVLLQISGGVSVLVRPGVGLTVTSTL